MSQETVVEQAVPVPPPSPRQVALGLFILFQLAFLIAANGLGFVEWAAAETKDDPKKLVNRVAPQFANEQGHGYAWCDKVETGTRRWMQLTGQDQDWSLFSPTVSKVTGVPEVLMLWDEPGLAGPSIKGSKLEYTPLNGFHLVTAWNRDRLPDNVVWLPSENAPANEKNYVKIGKARVRRLEGVFYINVQPTQDPPDPREKMEDWMTRRMRRLVSESHDPVWRYLQWRVKTWQRLHPDESMPRQVILFQLFYRMHHPDEEPRGWDGPFMIPQVRWLTDAKEQKGQYLLEPFDYSDQRFHNMAQ